jgi:L-phenylalanine/L-methionine N-acetyltransferase
MESHMNTVSAIPSAGSTASHPQDELFIRAFRPSDAEELADLINGPGYRWGTLRLPHQSPEGVRKWIESFGPTTTSLVAIRNGHVVGSADLEHHQGRRSHVGSLGMGVRDGCTRQGIGTALLHELLHIADQWLALKRLELTVFVDNAPAITLYERHGFEREGTHRAYAFRAGEYVDALAMARLKP